MPKRTAATLGGVIAAILLIAGIAWASGADDSPSSSTAPSTSTSLEDNGSSTSVNGQTSTSVGDSTSSSSANSSTSTTIDDNTSSTVDDKDDRDDNSGPGGGDDDRDDNSGQGGGDDDRDDNSSQGGDEDDDAVAVADGIHSFDVAGVGRVTVNVANGTLQLVDVEASAGWTAEIDEARADRIKVKFRNGESEAEFEAELEHGGLEVEVEAGS